MDRICSILNEMLSRVRLIKTLVDIASVKDIPILKDDRNLPKEICHPEDRETVRRMASIIDELLRDFEYLHSPEFEEEISGKSPALIEMKQRLADEPVRRREHRKRFERALGDVLSCEEVFRLIPHDRHDQVKNLIGLAGALRNPDDESC